MQYFAGHGKKQKPADEVMRFRQHDQETVSETAYRVCQSTGGENSTGGLPDEAGRKSERGDAQTCVTAAGGTVGSRYIDHG